MRCAMFRALVFVGAGTLASIAATPAAAIECPPSEFLKPDTLARVTDISTKLSYVYQSDQNSKKEDRDSFVKNVYSAYGISNTDYNRARSVSDVIKNVLNIDFSERQQEWILISQISEAGLDAYRECVRARKDNLTITFSENVMISPTIFLQVYSHPTYASERHLPVKAQILNGDFGSEKVSTFAGTVEITKSITIPVRRNLDIATNIMIEVDGHSKLVSLPARPAKKLVPEVRSGDKFDLRLEQTHSVINWQPFCVRISADEDAFVVPESGDLSFERKVVSKGTLQVRPKAGAYNSKEACAEIYMSLGDISGAAYAKGEAKVSVVKAVPIR